MSDTQAAPEAVPPLEGAGAAANADSKAARVRRTAPQLLADQLIAADFAQARRETETDNSSGKDLNEEELIRGAPSRNGGRLLTADRDPWTHNAWYALFCAISLASLLSVTVQGPGRMGTGRRGVCPIRSRATERIACPAAPPGPVQCRSRRAMGHFLRA